MILDVARIRGLRCSAALDDGAGVATNNEAVHICCHAGSAVYAADVLSEIFFPREAGAGAALAVVEGAEEGFLGPAVHFVHFAFVAEQAAAVGEALEFLAAFDVAFVRTVVLVHVLAPFTLPIEEESCTILVPADHLAFLVPRRFFGALIAVVLPQRSVLIPILRRAVFRCMSAM